MTTPFPTVETTSFLYAGRENSGNFDPIRGTIVDRFKDLAARRDLLRIVPRAAVGRIRSMLDFGTGNGRFALVGAELFAQSSIDAVDFDAAPPRALRGHPRIAYHSIEAFATKQTRYDVILLRHVLEHIHDPVAMLSDMARHLADDGVLYIEVPNLDSAYVRLFAERSNALFVPFHLFHFNALSLSRVIERAGLTAHIREKEMPLMSVVLSNLLRHERTLADQLLGAALHPLQIAAGLLMGKPCLLAVCKHRADTQT
jgi:2-polyprenyl-3-methyl-5-hydroxy-6-metoxy-1,4-benzoquinol methylase